MNRFLKKAARQNAVDLSVGYQITQQQTELAKTIATALKHHQEGRLHMAEQLYASVLAEDPENRDGLHLMGALQLQYKKYDDANKYLKRAVELYADSPDAWSNYGTSLDSLGKSEEAVAAFQKALSLSPRHIGALYNLANCFMGQKAFDAAVTYFRTAASVDPGHSQAFSNMAYCLHELGKYDEAMSACHSAILANNRNVKAYNTLGLALMEMGQVKNAVETFRSAIKLDPTYAVAYGNLGRAFLAMKQPAQALEACIQAVQLDGRLAAAHVNRASALRELGRLDESTLACQRAVSVDPQFAEAHMGLGNIYLDSSLPEEAIKSYRKVLESRPGHSVAHSNILMAMQGSPYHTALQLKEEAMRWGVVHGQGEFGRKPKPSMISRIGFIGGDFNLHPVGRFLEALFANLDRSRYDIVVYANQAMRDSQTEILNEYAGAWRPIIGLDNTTVTAMVEQDEVDVLVDLGGHSAGQRLGVFANHAAPIQVSWLGYSGTTGMHQMDALFGDAYVTPAEDDEFYTEKVVRLDGPWLCFTPPRIDRNIVALPSREGQPFTFGSFNHTRKINKVVIETWAEILKRVPGSRILIKCKTLISAALRRQYLGWFKEFGVESDRVNFRQATTWASHFASFEQVDVCLDSFPYCGATTTLESLWMGVPVVTLEGVGHHARMSAGILKHLSLDMFVAGNREEYINLAVEAGANLEALSELRGTLRDRLENSVLCDGKRFAESFSAAVESLVA